MTERDDDRSPSAPVDGPYLVDVMGGSLATILRMCGKDTAYALDRGVEADAALVTIARQEDRTILTRDRQLGARECAITLTATDTDAQLRELAARGVELSLPDRPERCSSCNGRLTRIEVGPTPAGVPDLEERPVWQCPDCGQYFWRGSHWDDVADRLAAITADRNA